ncbi:VCPKMT, partial [Symbiodinium pilosum]
RLRPCAPAELRRLRNKQRDDYIMARILVRDKALGIKHLASQKHSEHGVGGNLWGAALVLCRFLASPARPAGGYLAGKTVLELGSGTGAAGLAAASLGAAVTLTDLPQVLPLTFSNMAANSLCSPNTKLALLDWKAVASWPQDALPNYDLILCSDVLYWSDVVPDLAALLGRLLQNGRSTLLWCWVKRHEHVAREMWRALAAQDLVIGRLPLESGLLRSEDFCHVSRHVEAFVGCARGGRLDEVIAKDAMHNFVLDEDGCVKGVYSHACANRS